MSDWDKLQAKMQKGYDDMYAEFKSPPLDKQQSSAKYDELFNVHNQIDTLEREGEYDFDLNVVEGHPDTSLNAKSPLLRSDATGNNIEPIQDASFNEIEGMQDELTIIYKKCLLCTLVIVILCAIVFTTAIIDGFYNWNGVSFNSFVIIVGLYGIFIHICCKDGSNTLTKRKKLKHLLSFFILALICILAVFVIAMIYVVLFPLRISREDEYSAGVVAACIGFGVLGVIFWTIFVLFYIDLCGRACLKRGRIEFVIIELESTFWNRLYRFIITFRIKFRVVRRLLTAITGIHCIRGRLKLVPAQVGKLHEEQRAMTIVEYDEDTCTCCQCEPCQINLRYHMSQISGLCVKCICCPCVVLEMICVEINPCYVVSFLVFCGLFAPLAMWLLITLCVGIPCIMTDTLKRYWAFALVIAAPILYLVWYSPFGICPNNLFNTQKFPSTWNWTAQCMIWDYASLIFLYILDILCSSSS